ncbi:MAG: D-alanine--D-alanine ligase [Leptospiraceae bacterium]|nr:D-alanine--D-alanine ligase [Leptospiraceae bacterium]
MQNVGLLFGGKSAEHEISILSARNIDTILKQIPVSVVWIYLNRAGAFFLIESQGFPESADLEKLSELSEQADTTSAIKAGALTGHPICLLPGTLNPVRKSENGEAIDIDVFFPIVHGTGGEDGVLQGLFHALDRPFVGCDVFASALGMDKSAMKVHLEKAGIPSARYITVQAHERANVDFADIEKSLGLPVFIKPARQGSSVGVSRAGDAESFGKALDLAFRFDSCILIEEQISGKEIECAVMGNEEPAASIVGQILPNDGFYSYESKYIDADGAKLLIPADISEEESERTRKLALDTFRALHCEGLARIDCFLTADGKIYINEINTLPGFTNISMYPTLWEKSGLGRPELLKSLLDLAIQRKKRQDRLETRH